MDETVTPDQARQRMIDLMDAVGADYKIYSHRPIRNYDDAELARQESGFSGTESKSLVLPTETVQIRGEDIRKVFAHVANSVEDVTTFNMALSTRT